MCQKVIICQYFAYYDVHNLFFTSLEPQKSVVVEWELNFRRAFVAYSSCATKNERRNALNYNANQYN